LRDFSVQVRWGEALTQGCIEQSNVYDIYDASNGNHIFVALERSEDCARCCCAPGHSLFVEIKTTAGMQVRVRATATATATGLRSRGCRDHPIPNPDPDPDPDPNLTRACRGCRAISSCRCRPR